MWQKLTVNILYVNFYEKNAKKRKLDTKSHCIFAQKKNDIDNCKTDIKSVDVNETDKKMRTPLHVAMIFTNDALCDLLLRYGADVHVKDSYIDDPLYFLIVLEKTDSFFKSHSLSSIREKFLTSVACH